MCFLIPILKIIIVITKVSVLVAYKIFQAESVIVSLIKDLVCFGIKIF